MNGMLTPRQALWECRAGEIIVKWDGTLGGGGESVGVWVTQTWIPLSVPLLDTCRSPVPAVFHEVTKMSFYFLEEKMLSRSTY